jgi:putative addiction module component (TIGR02574 family)
MSSPTESIFELSLSEKLQLVEDLWDDIASNREDVPVHDWQKEELTRRKQNLLSNRLSAELAGNPAASSQSIWTLRGVGDS